MMKKPWENLNRKKSNHKSVYLKTARYLPGNVKQKTNQHSPLLKKFETAPVNKPSRRTIQ